MLSYLQDNCDFNYNNKILKLTFKGKNIYNDIMKNPMVFKLQFENNILINIENIMIK